MIYNLVSKKLEINPHDVLEKIIKNLGKKKKGEKALNLLKKLYDKSFNILNIDRVF